MRRLAVLILAGAALAVPALSGADAAPTNLARGALATATSQQSSAFPAGDAIDGNSTLTRWSSAFSDPQTITLDLGARASISEIKLLWEAAYGKAYTLEVSDDGSAWTTVETVTDGDGGTDDFTGLTTAGRYVRMVGTQRATQFGYSLFEFEVYGEFTATAVSLPPRATPCPRRTARWTSRCGSTAPPVTP